MFEHPQFTYDRYAQEIKRVEAHNELVRAVRERTDNDVRPRRRLADLFRRRADVTPSTDVRMPDRGGITVRAGSTASASAR